MTEAGACFKIMDRWEGDEESRLLFAALVETEPSWRYLSRQRTVPSPWPCEVTFDFEGAGVEDVPFQNFGWFLVSERIRTLIEEATLTGIRFYPIRAVSKVSFPLPRYWYGHLQLLDNTIDFERSTYSRRMIEKFGDELLMMIKFAFKRSEVDGWDFFRASDSPESMFCSARFHDLALKHRCTGIDFRPVPVS